MQAILSVYCLVRSNEVGKSCQLLQSSNTVHVAKVFHYQIIFCNSLLNEIYLEFEMKNLRK